MSTVNTLLFSAVYQGALRPDTYFRLQLVLVVALLKYEEGLVVFSPLLQRLMSPIPNS